MILQDKKANTYMRSVSEFKGLNRLPVNAEGELNSSENMVFDLYPVMSVRRGRSILGTVGGVQGVAVHGEDIAYVAEGTLYLNDMPTALTGLGEGRKSLVFFWGKIFIYPGAKYYDTATGLAGDVGTAENAPDLDYVCVHNNRIWGVKGNEIHASALGWAMGDEGDAGIPGWIPSFDDIGDINEAGAWALSVASTGDFTGIASWDDKIVALKRYCHHEISGSYPSNFALSTVSKIGTVNHNTLQEVGGKLIFVSDTGVQSYGGSFERNIGRPLHEDFTAATIYSAGTDGVRYYLSANFGGVDKLYVYHSELEMWTEEDPLCVAQFVLAEGYVIAYGSNGAVTKFAAPDSEEEVEWSFSFNDYADTIYNETMIPKLMLKLKGERYTEVNVEMAVDDGNFEQVKSFILNDNILYSVKCNIRRGKEHMFRISGKGKIEIYGYRFVAQYGGDNIV